MQTYRVAIDFVPAIIVVIMNSISIPVLFLASRNEKHITKDAETSIVHHLIVIVWFVNTIFVLIFFTQSLKEMEWFGLDWYRSVCSTLGLTLIEQCFPILLVGYGYYFYTMLRRYCDRGMKSSLYKVTDRRKLNDENSDQVSTNLITQKQLYQLYTGPQFRGGMVQSQVTTVIFICLFFSGTMPLLYPIALVYIVLIFWFSKFFMLKFCQITTIFESNLVLNSYKTLKYAMFMHLLMTLIQLANSDMIMSTSSQEISFSTTVKAPSLDALVDEKSRPGFINGYISFFVVVLAFFAVNLFFINPFSVVFIIGNFIKEHIDKRKMSTELRHERIKKYIENSEHGDAEIASNIDIVAVPRKA